MFGETEIVSSHEGDEEEEGEVVESDYPRKRRRKKWTASEDSDVVVPKRGEIILSDSRTPSPNTSPRDLLG